MSSHRGGIVPLDIPAGLHGQLAGLAQRTGASLFMVLQAALRACSAGSAAAPTSRSAARLPAAPMRRSTIWSASSSTRWCCAPTSRASRASSELIGRVRASQSRRLRAPGPAVRAAGRGAQPGALAVAAPAVPGHAGVRDAKCRPRPLDLAGLDGCSRSRSRPRARSSTSRSASPSIVRLTAGRPASRACWNTQATCSTQRASRSSARGSFACWLRPPPTPTRPLGALPILDDAERDTIIRLWNDTATPVPPATLPELFAAAGRTHAGRHRGDVRGPSSELRSARRPRQPPGASAARARRWPGCAGRPLR